MIPTYFDYAGILPRAPMELYSVLAWEFSRCPVGTKTSFFPEQAELDGRRGVHNDSVVARLNARELKNTAENRTYLELIDPVGYPALDRQLQLTTNLKYESMGDEVAMPTQWARKHFPETLAWIEQLPFASIGRIILWESYRGSIIPLHRDLPAQFNPIFKGTHQFIYFDLSMRRGLELGSGVDKLRIDSPAFMFNTSALHEAPPSPGSVLTLRVDGRLSADTPNPWRNMAAIDQRSSLNTR